MQLSPAQLTIQNDHNQSLFKLAYMHILVNHTYTPVITAKPCLHPTRPNNILSAIKSKLTQRYTSRKAV